MVGKSDVKSSRIFHQCYLKCCKLQNLTPLNNVIPSGNGKVVDFCVDRIKYADWPPILNALSCDLSLHSVSIKCRQPVKTVLEHIDCERLAKTVNKRAVILTNFMLSNLLEAISQLLSNTTLLTSLLLEGLPLKIPYLNPICEALLTNSSLQHLYLPRSLIGDAGCIAICKAVRCLPNILTMDLSGCELTPLGAGYIADLIKYQKIHRYSENWVHTLRYRLPDLDTMAGLRRITLCGNPQLGDLGVRKLLHELADDLWIKALDIQNCGLTEDCASDVLQMMQSNTTLVILDMRYNPLVSIDALSKIRSAVRKNERGIGGQYSWLGSVSGHSSDDRSVNYVPSKNVVVKQRVASNVRNVPKYNAKTNGIKKEKDYAEILEEQLQEETSHRRQLEELNERLVQQMRSLKQQQIHLWQNNANYSGSEQSLQVSSRSGDVSSSSGSTSSVPIDQNTLSYIQQAFKDIYAFIKNNQCHGECLRTRSIPIEEQVDDPIEVTEIEEIDKDELRVNFAKKAQSTHIKMLEDVKIKKITKSAHLIGDKQQKTIQNKEKNIQKPEMFERQIGDSRNAHGDEQSILEEIIAAQKENRKALQEHNSPCSSVVSDSPICSNILYGDSSDTLVYSPKSPRVFVESVHARVNPRDALYSSSDEDS